MEFEKEDDWKKYQWKDMTDQHFIIWMRTAGLPDFRKLWGRIEHLNKANYTLRIENNYDVSKFHGTKSFIISSTNVLGGKNYFLAVCYIVVGTLCLLFAFIFFMAWITK